MQWPQIVGGSIVGTLHGNQGNETAWCIHWNDDGHHHEREGKPHGLKRGDEKKKKGEKTVLCTDRGIGSCPASRN